MGFLSGIAGSLVSGVLGGIGSKKASRQESQAVQQAAQASQPISVFGAQGSAEFDEEGNRLNLNLSPEILEQMRVSGALGSQLFGAGSGLLGSNSRLLDASSRLLGASSTALDKFENYDQDFQSDLEFNRLRDARRPEIAQARQRLQAQLLNRGRLGVGVGGGHRGALYNPETAGLEEGIYRAQLGDFAQARDWAVQYGNNLLNQYGTLNKQHGILNETSARRILGANSLFASGRGMLTQQQSLGRAVNDEAALGIAARHPTGIAALQAKPGFNQASTTRGFFSGLGTTLGNAVEDTDWTGTPRPTAPAFEDYYPYGRR